MPENFEQSSVTEETKDFVTVLDEVMAEVLATMFFADCEPAPCNHAWLASAFTAQLGFAGRHVGETLVSVSSPAAQSIASGFLGLDPRETNEADCRQVVLELSNILCGAILSRLWPDSKLMLSAPGPATWESGLEGSAHRCFNTPEGSLAWCIRLREPGL